MTDAVDQARAAFEEGAWGVAFTRFSAADTEQPLVAEDLERLAVAAQLVGEDELSAATDAPSPSVQPAAPASKSPSGASV